jgi:Cu/Zn superoxide dismutase
MTHGLLKSKERHYGDLGNVLTEDGRIFVVIEQLNLSFEGKNSVLNRSVVLHERLDDGGLGTDPTSKTAGNSGGRIACGTIRLKN